MQTITTIGFDIAKSVFQVHCVDAEGKGHPSTPTQAALRAGLLPKAAAVLGWHRMPAIDVVRLNQSMVFLLIGHLG